jgi:hypothetical protein
MSAVTVDELPTDRPGGWSWEPKFTAFLTV